MAIFRFTSVADVWPAGTSVSAYAPGTSPAGGTSGSAVATASVASDGSLTFSGLTNDTAYVATDGVRSRRFRSAVGAGNSSSAQIDLCRGSYNVKPGDDITTNLQDAINTLAATGKGGEITFSEPGTYLINGAQQTGTAFGYSYSGQILFPATADRLHEFAITIKGLARANSSNDADSGGANGVVLVSNATAGNVFDCVPGFTAFGAAYGWTGVQPGFEDIVLVCPDNPQCGGINATIAFRFHSKNLTIKTTSSFAPAGLTGSGVALSLGQLDNSGDTDVEAQITGFPVGIAMSEHAVLRKVYIGRCYTAFHGTGRAHANKFVYVSVEECVRVFWAAASPDGMLVEGMLDGENVVSDSYAQGKFVDEWAPGSVTGYLVLAAGTSWKYGFALGTKYSGIGLDLVNVVYDSATGTVLGSPGWKGRHPSDDFKRNGAITTESIGSSHPTLHPWRTAVGGFTITSNKVNGTAGSGSNAALLPCRNGGETRAVQGTFTLAASGDFVRLYAGAVYNGAPAALQSNKIAAEIVGTTFNLNINGVAKRTLAGAVTRPNTYTVTLEVFHNSQGNPYFVRALIGATVVATYGLTAAEQALLAPGTTYPFREDGFDLLDVNSTCNSFQVLPLTNLPPSMGAGTVTLVAGTATVTDAAITASSVIRLNRQTAGGTTGQLSVTLTAGTGFSIASSSGTDTSTVYYEVVSY